MEAEPHMTITDELLEMASVDQEMRMKAIKDDSLWDETIDRRNTERLKQIVDEIGWPTITRVGVEASHSAWTLVQHATEVPEFMQHCLELMKAAEPGDVLLAHIAYLEDRLLTMLDKPQLYGTQFKTVNGMTEPFPIEDPTHVDERRAAMGLNTFAEGEAELRALYE